MEVLFLNKEFLWLFLLVFLFLPYLYKKTGITDFLFFTTLSVILVFILANPAIKKKEKIYTVSDIEGVFLFDTSLSMAVTSSPN